MTLASFRLAFLVLALAACRDGPTEPDPLQVPANLAITTGNAQSATAGANVPVVPTVRIVNARGEPVTGVLVRFDVVLGGGSIEFPSARTDAQGVASAGRWTLGELPGANTLQASAQGVAAVHFRATATSPFHIDVRFIGSATGAQRATVHEAVERWRAAIIRDVPEVFVTTPKSECFNGQPALSEVVDDLLLFVEIAHIDGAGDVLGQSGPCYVRTQGDLPIVGFVLLDASDLPEMESLGTLDDLMLHEIGHVLGFGTVWPDLGLLSGAGGSNPLFTGSAGVAAFRLAGGTSSAIPVENTGSSGTRDSHWRESVLRDELMTGYLSAHENPMSAITIASLQDLGYTATTTAATPFMLAGAASRAATQIDLHGREEVRKPTHRVGPLGERRRMR